ncbi:ketopantoate reductase family protein [Cytobacillus solani]|uniref:2-dehydropantoate 2-reductase n=1 Tax=Cytobacillus solani TaxID=1637975 RepID=A0A0Q3VJP7_9BACI|nr:2-dehydropantoate 2-reductase [Cytobacillus solani]KOP71700.1 2-dehydropantoate 2-reductase [Bacillus sp. FJAT-21945]KQL21626.1 2-dehydropantoate 2-reductase [Cytobacillus solani]USK54937.1 2-dehydropantoate 2-reductase [Cytobacillus solani]
MRIAIMGAGSLGTIIGAFLSKGKEHVELIDVNEEHVKALNETGASVIGTIKENVPVQAITPKEMTGAYDLVLLLTKQVFNKDVLANLKPFLTEDSIVLSLQNGVPEESLVSSLGKNRVIGGSVEFGATWVKPGVSELTTAMESFKNNAFQIGELDGTITDRIHNIKEVLNLVGGTVISTNLVGTKWSKLLVNVAMSGMSAALGCTYGDILKNETAVTSAVMLADETLQAGSASGVEFTELAGIHVGVFKVNEDKSNLSNVIGLAKKIFEPQALLKASMLQDLEKQRKTEIDYINGVVSAKGKEFSVRTPFNDLVVSLVKQAEDGKTIPNFDENIVFFKELISKEI